MIVSAEQTHSNQSNIRKTAGVAAIILAAGMGKRMNSTLPKVAHPVCGKPMVRYVVDAAHGAGIDNVVTVVGYGADIVKPLVEGDTTIAYQKQMLGTGDAVNACRELFEDFEGGIVVLSGDCPLITSQTIKTLIQTQKEQQAAAVVLTMVQDNPFGYGRIIRDENGEIMAIVEQKDATEEQALIKECNSGFYCFDAKTLFEMLKQVDNNNAQSEYYLTDVLGLSRKAGKRVIACIAQNNAECVGINTPEQLAAAEAIMQG